MSDSRGDGVVHPIAAGALEPGDTLDLDGTHWHVAKVRHHADGAVDVLLRRLSCNGLPGTSTLRLARDAPLVATAAPPGRRHIRPVGGGGRDQQVSGLLLP